MEQDGDMKTGLILGTGKFELREVDNPVVRKGGAVVAISLCGICGSDIGAYKHGDDSPFAYPPAVCGHEWCGVIEDLDPEIDYLAVGDRVIFFRPSPRAAPTALRVGKANIPHAAALSPLSSARTDFHQTRAGSPHANASTLAASSGCRTRSPISRVPWQSLHL
ncbi:alcohol dehydrogenase catalytic domain-containing protein [Novosphingobium colocasiae]